MTQPGAGPDPDAELTVVFEEPVLKFAQPQPDPSPPTTAKGQLEAAAQMRQAFNDSYTQTGGEAVDGTQQVETP